MSKVSVGSVNKILLILAQSLYVLYYKRNIFISTHDLLGVCRELSLLHGGATNRRRGL